MPVEVNHMQTRLGGGGGQSSGKYANVLYEYPLGHGMICMSYQKSYVCPCAACHPRVNVLMTTGITGQATGLLVRTQQLTISVATSHVRNFRKSDNRYFNNHAKGPHLPTTVKARFSEKMVPKLLSAKTRFSVISSRPMY